MRFALRSTGLISLMIVALLTSSLAGAQTATGNYTREYKATNAIPEPNGMGTAVANASVDLVSGALGIATTATATAPVGAFVNGPGISRQAGASYAVAAGAVVHSFNVTSTGTYTLSATISNISTTIRQSATYPTVAGVCAACETVAGVSSLARASLYVYYYRCPVGGGCGSFGATVYKYQDLRPGGPSTVTLSGTLPVTVSGPGHFDIRIGISGESSARGTASSEVLVSGVVTSVSETL